MKTQNTFRLDRVELRVGQVFYVAGASAIYINDRLHSVVHPNPYTEATLREVVQ